MSDAALRVAIALGSNMQDRYELLQSAIAAMAALDGVTLHSTSRIEETEPFGPPQPFYLNAMVLVATTLSLPSLLSQLQLIEAQHGRDRAVSKGPRTIDLDIVWASDVTVTLLELLIPHPGLTSRDFWQRELAELLGVSAAAEAIAAAQVHSGMETSERDAARHEHRWSGSWDTVD
ncbi:MAG: 2-amino-4-hydroxy-6-hydroxymethyldihydropteridine diphosphokinase [Gemmatimonadaceae bacterium]|nr:2-amino-4-hydroxy-6-hydroxymethyldihydropteridine diphosphokinase [Gemmatimonadaceae bacterium]